MTSFLPSISTFFNRSLPSLPFTTVSWQTIDPSPVKPPLPTMLLPLCAEQRTVVGAKTVGRLPVRTRRSNQCVILEWQTSRSASMPGFVLYRGSNLHWETAAILDLSIFSVRDSLTEKIYYSAVDRKPISPKPTYYWIVMRTSNRNEQRFGPFTVALDNEIHYT